jgi:hypothetical protein
MEGYDYASQREAAAGPGSDTRQWISNGVVNADTSTQKSVDFSGAAGPLVSVRLHPSDIDVRCRVASFVAGTGQGEWHPFVGGDEVLVAFPLGHERGGAVIIGRLNNGVDTFPTNVANQDVTQNSTTTRISIPNFAWSVSNGWLLRSSVTSAQLALDVKGGWMINSGDLHFLNLSTQGVALSLVGMTSFLSIDASTGRLVLSAGSGSGPGKSIVTLDPGGNLYASTQGSPPVGHVATVEGMIATIASILTAFGLVIIPTPVSPAQTLAAVEAGIAASGVTPPYAGPIAAAVLAKLGIPRDITGQISPGLGSPGFFV